MVRVMEKAFAFISHKAERKQLFCAGRAPLAGAAQTLERGSGPRFGMGGIDHGWPSAAKPQPIIVLVLRPRRRNRKWKVEDDDEDD
jgi:hypothetical protein